MKILVVIDMQNDFIDGALGTAEAMAIVGNVRRKIEEYRVRGDLVLFTRDTHPEHYLETQEGKKLPVPHCIKGTEGWKISPELEVGDSMVFDKPGFGSYELADWLAEHVDQESGAAGQCAAAEERMKPEQIELIGLCTDICVISNAMMLKSRFTEIPVVVDASCCAGVTPESHENALKAMEMCQIDVIGRTE